MTLGKLLLLRCRSSFATGNVPAPAWYLGGDWNTTTVPERSVLRLASYWAFLFWYSVVINRRLLSRASISMVKEDTSSIRGISDFKPSMVRLEDLQQNKYFLHTSHDSLILPDHCPHIIFPTSGTFVVLLWSQGVVDCG